jgi:hypothetical protein
MAKMKVITPLGEFESVESSDGVTPQDIWSNLVDTGLMNSSIDYFKFDTPDGIVSIGGEAFRNSVLVISGKTNNS